ncbi:hypothetical protein [Halalkalibacter alkalisediminis]|uniref:Phage protein n=1 Tax=Halalkalibacter alkalisediminis TaxID=935616 RepID=A0ABV6NFY5_9BACI|nr:hypothetical protein [Halalkalibacter alkalisediminis]
MNKTAIQTNNDTYLLRFSINAHCEAEQLLGFPITQLSEDTAGMTTFRTLLFVGLKFGGNPVPMDKAGDIMEEVIQDQGMDYFSDKISEAINKGLAQQQNSNFKQQHNSKKN